MRHCAPLRMMQMKKLVSTHPLDLLTQNFSNFVMNNLLNQNILNVIATKLPLKIKNKV